MRKTKRMLTLLLAVIMMLAMSATAFAATITIENGADGETYTAYKIFDVTYSDTGTDEDGNDIYSYAYTISTSSAFFDWIKNYGSNYGITLTQSKGDSGTYVVTVDTGEYKNDDAWAKAFAEALAEAINDGTIEAVADKELKYSDESESNDISGLDAGYYLVMSTMGTLVMLDTADDSVTITEKNEKPTVEKTVSESGSESSDNNSSSGSDDESSDGDSSADSNDESEDDDSSNNSDGTSTYDDSSTASVGDTVYFKIEITVAAGATNYMLHDVMDEGLDFNEVTKICVNGVEISNDYYEVTSDDLEDGCTFEIRFNDSILSDDAVITVYYTATLTSSAIEKEYVMNKAKVSYGDGSYTEWDQTETYTYGFDLVKTDSSDNLLDGAEFKLTDSDGNDIYFLYDSKKNTYVVCEESETGATSTIKVANGCVRIDGLGSGTYSLIETKAPDGYNLLTESVDIVIEDADKFATFSNDDSDGESSDESADESTYKSGGVKVENQSGSELPSTGGMGTTILYAIGIILILGAGVVLVSKRRMRG